MYKKIPFFIIICFIVNICAAQKSEVRGTIYNKKNGELVQFATIYILPIQIGTATNNEGFYTISKITPGQYTMIIKAIGFDSLVQKIDLKANEILTKNFFLLENSINFDEISITAEKKRKTKDIYISITNITSKELKMIPTIGGEPDLVQFLQVLPGVVFSGDQGGQLYIRGGSPIMNKVMIDGMTIYNPFHSIGLFSVFDADIIKNAEVYSAGFGAEYGGRISAIVDIKTKDGKKDAMGGKCNINTFTSKILLEGPLKKFNPIDGSSTSFILSYKNSYLDKSSPIFYNYVGQNKLPYSFSDLYGKISFNTSSGTKLNLFGFDYSDKVNFKNSTSYGWNSKGFGGKFALVPAMSKTIITSNFSYSKYVMNQIELDAKPRQSEINGFNANMSFLNIINDNDYAFGIEINGFKTDFIFYNANNRKVDQQENTTELNAFFKSKIILNKKLILEPSFRLQFYASFGNISPEPRFRIKYNINRSIRLKAATGLYSQNLMSAVSDRDVVNLFYGFLSGPDEFPQQIGSQKVKSRLQKSIHGVAGIEVDLNAQSDINVEAYIKDFVQLTNINREKIYDDNPNNQNKPWYLRSDYIGETGSSYGFDITYKYYYKRLYFWSVYSYNHVSRFDGLRTYNPHFDRRHNINLLGTYKLLKDKSLDINLRWNFGSGFPFTQTQSFYEYLNFIDGASTNVNTNNGVLGIQYADLNNGRLPSYHRLDFSTTKEWILKKTKNTNDKLELIFSVTNIYNRANIFYFDRVKYNRVNQLPLLPSLAISYLF